MTANHCLGNCTEYTFTIRACATQNEALLIFRMCHETISKHLPNKLAELTRIGARIAVSITQNVIEKFVKGAGLIVNV
jgi:hypothetical protein